MLVRDGVQDIWLHPPPLLCTHTYERFDNGKYTQQLWVPLCDIPVSRYIKL